MAPFGCNGKCEHPKRVRWFLFLAWAALGVSVLLIFTGNVPGAIVAALMGLLVAYAGIDWLIVDHANMRK